MMPKLSMTKDTYTNHAKQFIHPLFIRCITIPSRRIVLWNFATENNT